MTALRQSRTFQCILRLVRAMRRATRLVILIGVLIGALIGAACSAAARVDVRRYQLTGVVVGREETSARIVIAHEAINELMPA